MDRVLSSIYGSIRTEDILNTNKNTMVALGYAMQAVLGTGTYVDGLVCTPTSPASLGVTVSTGSIYSLAAIDATAYGVLSADTTDQVVKQGIVIGATPFTITPPATSGQSVVYLIQAQYQEVDGGSTNLSFVNSTTGATFNNSVNTVRQGKCILSLKSGVIATTGSQTTPAPDAGYIGLWAITVANGATTITSGNIAQIAGAPFIGPKLPNIVASINTGSFLAFSTGSTTIGATANNAFGLNAAVGSVASAKFIIPFNYRLSNFYGYAASTPTVGSRAYTVVINGSATSLAATATGAAAIATDVSHSVTGSAGDQIYIQIVTSGSDVLAHKASLMIQQIT